MLTNEDIARWCGFTYKEKTVSSEDFNGVFIYEDGLPKKTPRYLKKTEYYDPDGVRFYGNTPTEGLPDFTTDLNAWDKYVFPKLAKDCEWDMIHDIWGWRVCIKQFCSGTLINGFTEHKGETLIEALNKALEPIIRGEK
jgi:hypothetical protein